jgi:hypothetical protein
MRDAAMDAALAFEARAVSEMQQLSSIWATQPPRVDVPLSVPAGVPTQAAGAIASAARVRASKRLISTVIKRHAKLPTKTMTMTWPKIWRSLRLTCPSLAAMPVPTHLAVVVGAFAVDRILVSVVLRGHRLLRGRGTVELGAPRVSDDASGPTTVETTAPSTQPSALVVLCALVVVFVTVSAAVWKARQYQDTTSNLRQGEGDAPLEQEDLHLAPPADSTSMGGAHANARVPSPPLPCESRLVHATVPVIWAAEAEAAEAAEVAEAAEEAEEVRLAAEMAAKMRADAETRAARARARRREKEEAWQSALRLEKEEAMTTALKAKVATVVKEEEPPSPVSVLVEGAHSTSTKDASGSDNISCSSPNRLRRRLSTSWGRTKAHGKDGDDDEGEEETSETTPPRLRHLLETSATATAAVTATTPVSSPKASLNIEDGFSIANATANLDRVRSARRIHSKRLEEDARHDIDFGEGFSV